MEITVNTRDGLSLEELRLLLRALQVGDETLRALLVVESPAPAVVEPPAAEETPDYDELRKLAVQEASALMKANRRSDLAQALATIGSPKTSQVPDDRLAEFLQILKSL